MSVAEASIVSARPSSISLIFVSCLRRLKLLPVARIVGGSRPSQARRRMYFCVRPWILSPSGIEKAVARNSGSVCCAFIRRPEPA